MLVAKPILVDTSQCADIAEALDGNRNIGTSQKNVVLLHTPRMLGSASNCTIRYIFLDTFSMYSSLTFYERALTEYDRLNTMEMWDRHTGEISPSQQLVVVTCDYTNSIKNDVRIPVDTDFTFILKEPRGLTTLDTVECKQTFCMVRITTKDCISSKYVQAVSPSTLQNNLNMVNLKVSMMGSASSMLKLTGFVNAEWRVPETRLILGVNFTGQYGTFTTTCVNEIGMSCSLEEATHFAAELTVGIKMILNSVDNAFEMYGLQKMAGSDNEYTLNYIQFLSEYGNNDPLMGQYFSSNRPCPRGAKSTGLTDTFYGETGIFKLNCVVCGINRYYHEFQIPAPVVAKNTTMYILRKKTSSGDYPTSLRILIRQYYAALHKNPENDFKKQFRQDSLVDIGTKLVLKLGVTGDDRSLAVMSTIVRIYYDEIDIDFTSEKHGTPDYAISLQITPELSGKLIRIDVVDPDCCNNANYDPNRFSSIWTILPILIFARPAEVVQECLLCPVGKFSGLALAKDSSACQNTMPSPADISNGATRRSAQHNTNTFKTFIDIDGIIIIVLEIRRIVPHALSESHFALEIWLDTNDLTMVDLNMQTIETKILHLYESQRTDVQISGVTHSRLVATPGPVILTLEGIYTNNAPGITELNPPPKSRTVWKFTWFWAGMVCCAVAVVVAIVCLIYMLMPVQTTAPLTKTPQYVLV